MGREAGMENPYSSPGSEPGLAAGAAPTGAVWEDDRLTVTFERTLDDYVAAEWCRMKRRRTGPGGCVKILLIATLCAVALLVAVSLSGGAVNWVLLGVGLFYFVFVGLVLSKRGRIRMLRRAFKQIVLSDAHEYLTPLRVVFTREGFECASHWERRSRPWSSVERLIVVGEHFHFVHGGVVTLVVPKRVFVDSQESDRFLEWVRGHIPVDA